MAITSVRLVDGEREMTLLPNSKVTVNSIDVPFPEVREVAEDRPDTDGSRDSTAFHGSRAVSIEAEFYDTPATLMDQVSFFLHPASRPYLYVQDTEWSDERRLRLRSDQHSGTIEGGADDVYREVQFQWKAPEGVWENASQETAVIRADIESTTGAAVTAGTGLHITPSGLVLPPSTAAGSKEVNIAGSVARLHWVARLYGPAKAPNFSVDTTNETIVFHNNVEIPAGDYVEIDSRDRTVYYNGMVSASRLQWINYAQTQWWTLRAGLPNHIRYHPVSGANDATVAHLYYRPTWF